MTDNIDDVLSIGHKRMKYLDLANMYFIQGDYISAEGCIVSFLETIKEDSPESEIIKKEFDKIEVIKNKQYKQILDFIKDKGECERSDIKIKGEQEILVESLHNKKTVCWNMAMTRGMFDE